MITLQLTDEEAASFRAFRANQANIEIMLAAGVFEMRRGSVEIHFDVAGNIGAIVGHPMLYKRDTIAVLSTG